MPTIVGDNHHWLQRLLNAMLCSRKEGGSTVRRQILGWTAISISTILACFWAFWGVNENFHEGWFSPSLVKNLGLMLVQYFSPMLIVLLLSMVAFRWPRLALPLMGACALFLVWFFRHGRLTGIILIVAPLVALAALYHFGRPHPRKWAWNLLLILPLITAIGFGIYPAWLAVHRFDDGNYGMRQIAGNGVTLVWAPEGPGWPRHSASWSWANQSCARLTLDGRSLADQPQNIWRLPTIDEAVRSLDFRGANAGGTWDPVLHRANYKVTPEKDSPLWEVHSPIIYWWTANEIDDTQAWYIGYNGYVQPLSKRMRPGDLAFRCVCEPGKPACEKKTNPRAKARFAP
jgi:hypothetical protein